MCDYNFLMLAYRNLLNVLQQTRCLLLERCSPEDAQSQLLCNGSTREDGLQAGVTSAPGGRLGQGWHAVPPRQRGSQRTRCRETQWKEECSALRRREDTLTRATTWANLEDIVLSKPVTRGRALGDPTDQRYPGAQFRHRNRKGGCRGLGEGMES